MKSAAFYAPTRPPFPPHISTFWKEPPVQSTLIWPIGDLVSQVSVYYHSWTLHIDNASDPAFKGSGSQSSKLKSAD